jgi:hypothetical protein
MCLLLRKLGLNTPSLKTLGQTAGDNIDIHPTNHTRRTFHGIIPRMEGQHRRINDPPAIGGGDIPRGRCGFLLDVHVLERNVARLIGGEASKLGERLDSTGRFAFQGGFEMDHAMGCVDHGDGSGGREGGCGKGVGMNHLDVVAKRARGVDREAPHLDKADRRTHHVSHESTAHKLYIDIK